MSDSDRWEMTPDHRPSDTDEWATPPDLLRAVDSAVGGFDLDPCSGAEEKSVAPATYTAEDDGLSKRWHGCVWVNPPYSEMMDWSSKCAGEAEREGVETVVLLAPARTSTQWFHRHVADADVLGFFEGRLSFGDSPEQNGSAPFPSLIAVFGNVPDDLISTLDHRGVVYTDRWRRSEQQRLV